MAPLTFSQFANILFPYCRNGQSEAKFIVTLSNKIMTGRPGAATFDMTYQNPLINNSTRARQYYFTGERSISQGDASKILNKIDKEKFTLYLRDQCSKEGLSRLKEDLVEYMPQGTIIEGKIEEFCFNLFVEILKDLASGKMDKRRKGNK